MTEAELQSRLTTYMAAEAAILSAQEYTIGQGSTARKVRRADLEQVRAEIKSIRAEIAALPPVGGRRGPVYLRPFN